MWVMTRAWSGRLAATRVRQPAAGIGIGFEDHAFHATMLLYSAVTMRVPELVLAPP
jgi:hypothetical protein